MGHKTVLGHRRKKRKGGAHFQIEIGLKNRPGSENIFSESSRRQDCEECTGAPSLDTSCGLITFDAFSREDLGHFSGHFSVVAFSRSNLGTFFECCSHIFSFKFRNFSGGLRLHFLGHLSECEVQLWTRQKHAFGKVLGCGSQQRMFPWKRFSRIFVWQLSRLATKRLWPASFESMTATTMSWLQKGKAPNRWV